MPHRQDGSKGKCNIKITTLRDNLLRRRRICIVVFLLSFLLSAQKKRRQPFAVPGRVDMRSCRHIVIKEEEILQIRRSESETSVPQQEYSTKERKRQKKVCSQDKPSSLFRFFLHKKPPERRHAGCTHRRFLPLRRFRYFLRPL